MADDDLAPPGWYADPFGRHERRYFDGRWTERVSDHGFESADSTLRSQSLFSPVSYRRVPSRLDTAAIDRDSPAERRFRRVALWFRAILLPALVVAFIGMLATSADGHAQAGWADALAVVSALIFLGAALMWIYRLRTLRPGRQPGFPNADSGRPPA